MDGEMAAQTPADSQPRWRSIARWGAFGFSCLCLLTFTVPVVLWQRHQVVEDGPWPTAGRVGLIVMATVPWVVAAVGWRQFRRLGINDPVLRIAATIAAVTAVSVVCWMLTVAVIFVGAVVG